MVLSWWGMLSALMQRLHSPCHRQSASAAQSNGKRTGGHMHSHSAVMILVVAITIITIISASMQRTLHQPHRHAVLPTGTRAAWPH